jgi:hypothetical protein
MGMLIVLAPHDNLPGEELATEAASHHIESLKN